MSEQDRPLARFIDSLAAGSPPVGLDPLAEALWHDARGAWDRAHAIAQKETGPAAAAIHAYLHRKQGDLANADYWYSQAARTRPALALEAEWRALVREVLVAGTGKAR